MMTTVFGAKYVKVLCKAPKLETAKASINGNMLLAKRGLRGRRSLKGFSSITIR
jgi:hypothetical protein